MNAVVGELQGKKIVVKELVLIGLAVGREHQLLSIGRPVNGVLVVIALGELTHLLRSDVYNENMQALIVVEARHSFARVGFVEITRNDHGIATRFGGDRACRGGDKRNLPSIG